MQNQSLPRLLLRQLVPTPVQVMLALVLSALFILTSRLSEVAGYLGITRDSVLNLQNSLHAQTSGILSSSFASNIVLVTFWGLVGLIAYLVTWGIMNLIIEARNTVTVDTQYANRGHWRGPWETLAIKTVCGSLLIMCLILFQYGVSLWLSLAQPFFSSPTFMNAISAALAWIGFAAQLYLLLLLFVLTITPWYRTSAFTE